MMPDPRAEELVYADKLISEGKLKRALEVIVKYEQTAGAYFYRGDYERTLEIRLQCKELYEKIGKESYMANNLFLLGHIYLQKGERNEGLNCALNSLELYERINDQEGISRSYSLLGLAYNYKGKLDLAIEYSKKSLAINEISAETKVGTLNNLVVIYTLRGELAEALKLAEEGYKLALEEKNDHMVAWLLLSIGGIYLGKGNLERSIESCENCLIQAKKVGNTWVIGWVLYYLIQIYINLDEHKKAQDYLTHLQKTVNRTKDKSLKNLCLIAEGLVFKSSGRSRDRAEAEKLFKQIVYDEITNPQVYMIAVTFMCEFLIEELEMSNNPEIIDELDPLITKLINLAEKINSFYFLSFTKLFQSKLALIQMKFEESKKLLIQSQRIAEEHGFRLIAQKSSMDHDILLEQLNTWEQFKKNNAPMSERIKLASIDRIINQMKGVGPSEPLEIIEEEPILLLIMDNSGVTYFNHQFVSNWDHSDLFSSFMSAFNMFMDEIFSKSIDRIRVGENTILINPIESFLACYVIKGQSYPALQKLTRFTKAIRENTEIWEAINKSVKTSEMLELDKPPALKTVIEEIFTR